MSNGHFFTFFFWFILVLFYTLILKWFEKCNFGARVMLRNRLVYVHVRFYTFRIILKLYVLKYNSLYKASCCYHQDKEWQSWRLVVSTVMVLTNTVLVSLYNKITPLNWSHILNNVRTTIRTHINGLYWLTGIIFYLKLRL